VSLYSRPVSHEFFVLSLFRGRPSTHFAAPLYRLAAFVVFFFPRINPFYDPPQGVSTPRWTPTFDPSPLMSLGFSAPSELSLVSLLPSGTPHQICCPALSPPILKNRLLRFFFEPVFLIYLFSDRASPILRSSFAPYKGPALFRGVILTSTLCPIWSFPLISS